jgi:hypothetical protein
VVAGSWLPAYLVLVGAAAAAALALLSCDATSIMSVRYTLLGTFLAVGVVAWLLRPGVSRHVSSAATAAVVLWASASIVDSGRILGEYVFRPPPNRFRQLIEFLDRADMRFGSAAYWTSYQVTFLSGERIILASSDVVRVTEYQELVARAPGRTVTVALAPPCEGSRSIRVQDWCISDR